MKALLFVSTQDPSGYVAKEESKKFIKFFKSQPQEMFSQTYKQQKNRI